MPVEQIPASVGKLLITLQRRCRKFFQDHLLVHMEGLLIKLVLNGHYPPHCF